MAAWREKEAQARVSLAHASSEAADGSLFAPAVERIRREEYEEETKARRKADERCVELESQLYCSRVEMAHLKERLAQAGPSADGGAMAITDAIAQQHRALQQSAG